MSIYPTDALRLHETITDHGGLSGGLSRIMNVAEHLLIGHTILDCLLGDYVSALSDICFFIDGPLAFFGQPAWLHRPMQRLIFETNEKLKSLGQSPMMTIGIQKQGVVAEHSQMIRKYLPRDHFRFVDDEYRNRFLSPVKDEQVFGYETYYGRKRLNRGQTPPICRDRILTDWPRISLSKFAVSDPGYPGQGGG